MAGYALSVVNGVGAEEEYDDEQANFYGRSVLQLGLEYSTYLVYLVVTYNCGNLYFCKSSILVLR